MVYKGYIDRSLIHYFSNLAYIPQRACCGIAYFVVKTKINLGHYLSLQVAGKNHSIKNDNFSFFITPT